MSDWHPKAWGREEWLVNTELYCAKKLYVEPGWQCSLHCHAEKDETFLVLDGPVVLEVENGVRGMRHWMQLNSGDIYRIKPRIWHRFRNEEQGAAVILEVSTHHSDEDVERKEPSRPISA